MRPRNHKDHGSNHQRESIAEEGHSSSVYGQGYNEERIPYASQASSYPEYYRRSSERYGVMDWDQDSFYEPSSDYIRRRRLESERYADSSAQRLEYTWMRQGEHSGKGPKGYRRSDERIREDVCECLWQSGDIDARNIDLEVNNGEVTLKGTVHTRREKRLAEDLLERVLGVVDIHNHLRTDKDWQSCNAKSSITENNERRFQNKSATWGDGEERSGVQL